MKIELLVIGKTDADYLQKGIAEYEKRLTRYIPYEMRVIPDIKNSKNMSESVQKEREGECYQNKTNYILSHYFYPFYTNSRFRLLFFNDYCTISQFYSLSHKKSKVNSAFHQRKSTFCIHFYYMPQ